MHLQQRNFSNVLTSSSYHLVPFLHMENRAGNCAPRRYLLLLLVLPKTQELKPNAILLFYLSASPRAVLVLKANLPAKIYFSYLMTGFVSWQDEPCPLPN